MIFLRRIDEPKVLVQQAIYLFISGILLAIDLLDPEQALAPPFLLKKVWKYREFFLHFLLGTLLNSYTIFYFKSASGLTSFIFIFLLIAALTLTEFKKFGRSQRQVHMALWSLCLISYLHSLIPILLNTIGPMMFLASSIASFTVFFIYYELVKIKIRSPAQFLRTQLIYPYLIIHAIFIALYFTNAIPPVPLSVTYMGLYHGVEKREGTYRLSYSRPSFYFWQHGDETFLARPGDSVVAFVQVFLPTGFKEQLKVNWFLDMGKKGWQLQDTVPLLLTGGREEGFRATVTKNHYQIGHWRIQIQTMDGDEVGRISFQLLEDLTTEPREMRIDVR